MDKVEKVNIGGISFTVEENAYRIIDDYLKKLESHYQSDIHRNEILKDIEERMAELLIDRGGKGSVISLYTAKEVTDILGAPDEIDDGPGNGKTPGGHRVMRKKLYRNPADKILGGVFGGLSAYTRVDTVWLRLGFVALLFLSGFTENGWWNPGTLFLIYIILWICMPLARTTEQKCEMRGESLSYDDVERRMENRKNYDMTNSIGDRFWGIVGKCLLIIPGALLLIIGLTGFIAILAVLLGITVAGIALPAALSEVFTFSAMSPAWITASKVLAAIVMVLPFVGMLYGGISLLFKMKTPKWRPGLWMLIIWFLSLIGLIVPGIRFTKHYWHHDRQVASSVLSPAGNNIHIVFSDIDRWKDGQVMVSGDEDEYNLIYIDTDHADSISVAVYPSIRLRHTDSDECSIRVSSNLFNSTMTLEEMNKTRELGFYRFENDTLTLEPTVFGTGRNIKEIGREVTITVPEDMNAIIERPIFHQFDNDFEYSNMDISALRIKELEKTLRSFNIDIDLDDFAD